MKPKYLKRLLLSEIQSVTERADEFCVEPRKNFIRKRKLPFETVVKTIIGMESKSLSNELINAFDAEPDLPSTSAFVQQRYKIKPEAFKAIFAGFTSKITTTPTDIRILAVDGTDVHIATNPDDLSSFHPGTNGQKPYNNILHLNALYDLNQHIYTDAVIQGRRDWDEHSALQEMVDNSDIPKALIIADRGYESYNNIAHIQEKGWFFLIRIKDGKSGIKDDLEFPEGSEFDEKFSLKLTRRKNNEVKILLKDKNHYRFIPSTHTFDYLTKKPRKKTLLNSMRLIFELYVLKYLMMFMRVLLQIWTQMIIPLKNLKRCILCAGALKRHLEI